MTMSLTNAAYLAHLQVLPKFVAPCSTVQNFNFI